MEENYQDYNIEALVKHLRDGSKLNCVQKLGLEVEHIIVHKDTKLAVTYYEPYGIAWILESLKEDFPKHYYDGEDLLGLYNSDYSISIEPAGQFEISIIPKGHLETIEAIYNSFVCQVEAIIEDKGYEMLAIGYQPKSKVDDLPIIPKMRYEYMDRYFKTSGTMGRNMMRGTAATQVSIDYCNEKDFINKYRAAYVIMPALKLLSDNTPILEGKKYEKHIARTEIWNHVDAKRCGIIDGLFDEDFGFYAYARYLYHMPIIFLPDEHGMHYTGEKAAIDLYADKKLQESDIDHVLSMAFFDVRAKHYIEIRGADSMPSGYVLSYMALLKGLMFDKDTVKEILDRYLVGENEIKQAEQNISISGYEALVYGMPVQAFIIELLNMAERNLHTAEKKYLSLFRELVMEKATLAERWNGSSREENK